MNLKIIKGNILEAKTKYIAHQCNCTSRGSAGLAKSIFEKFPWANTYDRKRVPGTIDILGNGEDQRYVINMYGQLNPGKAIRHCYRMSKMTGPTNDSESDRLEYFSSCLKEIEKIKELESITFPSGVGCGLAGGDWNNYLFLLEEFAKCINVEVIICEYNINKIQPGVSQTNLKYFDLPFKPQRVNLNYLFEIKKIKE